MALLKSKTMQTVSFETAKRLKEAGFHQPSEVLDFTNRLRDSWLMFYVEPDEHGDGGELYSADRIEDIRTFGDPCEVAAFAPTATDVLPEDWLLMRDVEGWICQYRADFGIYVTHDNPAEAAAAAWFRENWVK